MKRNVGDEIRNGAVLIERVNGQLWKIRCKCGKEFIAQPSDSNGRCRECAMKLVGLGNTKHGESPRPGKNASRLYAIWDNMRSRCNNSNNPKYKDYGGRGISVCQEWDDFSTFKEWALENGYRDNLSIDRIDVNGGYSQENCRWATQKDQSRNTRVNHFVTYNGETKTIAEWAEIKDIPYHTLKHRINKYGFTAEEALTIPVKIGNNQKLRHRTPEKEEKQNEQKNRI